MFVLSTVKRKVFCALLKISRLLLLTNISMTCTFAAHGILDNFKISLVVLLPNTTTSHAITYTNTINYCNPAHRVTPINHFHHRKDFYSKLTTLYEIHFLTSASNVDKKFEKRKSS